MKKRILAMMLTASMAVSIAACGQQEVPGQKESTSSEVSSGVETKVEEPKEEVTFETAPVVTYLVNDKVAKQLGYTGDDMEDNDYVRYIFEKTGVRVKPIMLSTSEFTQQLTTLKAGGTDFDMILSDDITQAFIQNDIIMDISGLLEEYADQIPNIMNNISESGWSGMEKVNGIYGIPGRGSLSNPIINGIVIRKDWMDNLGLSMPTNTDEFKELLRAFTEDDPDGNGIDDTWGLCHNGDSAANLYCCLFGYSVYGAVLQDGRLVNSLMTEEAREVLAEIQSWDVSGYINRDGISDTSLQDKLIMNNKVGVVLQRVNKVATYKQGLNDIGVTDAEFVLCGPLECSLDGHQYGIITRKSNHATAAMITPTATDYESIFKLLDWFYTEEGTFFAQYGLEGKEYNMVDGKPVTDTDYVTEKSYLSMYAFGKSYNINYVDEAYVAYGNDEFARQLVDETINNFDAYVREERWTTLFWNYPDLEEFVTYPEYHKGVKTNLMKFITGELDPLDDATWAQYIEDAESYGYQKLLDATLKAWEADTDPDKVDLNAFKVD